MEKYWRDGAFGLVVADALGVPVEFLTREEVRSKNITGMTGHGTYDMPVGTWSDDSSMALATLASIREKNQVDPEDIMNRFVKWIREGEYTPFGMAFGVGLGTEKAIHTYTIEKDIYTCGGTGERDNGNGSLMRILPVCLSLYERQKTVCTSEDESIYTIHNVSALTHRHLRSQIACGIYYFLVKAAIDGEGDIVSRLQKGIDNSFFYYRRYAENYRELMNYNRLIDLRAFKDLPESEIKSTGYVVSTLEAAVWCLLNTDSYEAAVLKAVNLGYDTDTVGAVTGGLAGLIYGADSIPKEWIDLIQKKEWIESLVK